MVVAGIGNLLPPLATLAIAPVLAQTLGVVGRGELAAATAPYLLALSIATLGIPEALTQTVARFPSLARVLLPRATWIVALAGIVASAAIALAAPLLSRGSSELAILIIIAAVATAPALVISVLRGLASGLHAWKSVALERALSGAFKAVPVIILASTSHLTAMTATVCLAFAPVLAGVAYVGLRRITPKQISGSETHRPRFRALLSYGFRTWIGSISGILLLRVDQVLMTPLSSAYQLGLYAVAVNVSEVPLIVNTAVREVMFSADASDNDDKKLSAAARISSLICVIIAGLLIGTVAFWLPFLFGMDFVEAIPVAVVLIFAVALGVPGSIAGSGLSARGRPELRSLSILIACVVNIGLIFVLVPTWGALGAAVATLCGNLLSSNGNIYFAQRFLGISWTSFYGIRRSDLSILRTLLVRLLTRA
ncbi:oligosaccharide flippase family protein [Salinibacterium sp. ZJ454]|uniref:oligosaccharide flippase family protein n=1 Tax=Salinibacterium sp. ZJ454 TaxID=2708339 RepID=UPI001FBB5092|nr:oligosaccharide flippase family protein [Salinibacterium sp. ZJ454]